MVDNYKDFLTLLNSFDHKPSLLLHSCCGPCSTSVLKKLLPYFNITIYYYNPNIYPEEEFDKRLLEEEKVIKKLDKNIKLISEKEPYSVYLDNVKGYTDLQEGSLRCYKCYEFRLKKLADKANELGFEYFTTVMSVSPYKNSKWINEIGYSLENTSKFLYSDFKKEDGYKESIRLSKEMGLYRQDYCGCLFSYNEHNSKINQEN